MVPRIHRRSAVTVCSLRLRPRWAWPASSPTISPRRSSTKLCTSSTSRSRYSGSFKERSKTTSSALSRASLSSAGIAPHRPRARTNALDPAISSARRRRSKEKDRLNSQKTASGPAA